MNRLSKSLLAGLLEMESNVKAFFGGGFKPPTKGHFLAVKKALEKYPEIDELNIIIGSGIRDNISQDESYSIWEIYKKHLPLKVNIIKADSSPLAHIKNYVKNNTTHKSYIILGGREDNDEDFEDIRKRTEFFEKYGDHIEIKQIITPGGVSGTKAREAATKSKDQFFQFLPNELTQEERELIYTYIRSEIQESQIKEEDSFDTFDYPQHIKSLTEFMLNLGLNIKPLPSVKFINDDADNAKDFFGKTAYYDPQHHRIVLYTLNRHPKDVMRSFAHEMVHHMQNCEDRLGNITTQNTTEDGHLDQIEREAYEKGNITFRNWTDTLTEGVLKEGRYDKLTNQISSKIFNTWKSSFDPTIEIDEEQYLTHSLSINEHGLDFNVYASLLLDPGVDGFETLDTTGAGTDKNGDFIEIHLRIDPGMLPQFWGGISMTLKDIVRHEIEHLTHNIGAKSSIKPKELEDDNVIRALIKAKLISQGEYWKLPKEIDASLQGMYFRAKKIRKPLKLVVNNYLDSQDITPEEKQEILQLWNKRAKQLNLPPVLQENLDPSQITVYLDMDGVLADFDERFRSLSGMTPDEYRDKYGMSQFWNFIDEENKLKFWVGIPVMPGADKLVNYVSKYHYEILTAPSIKKQSRLGKILWVRNHASLFNKKPLINFKSAKEKHLIKPNLTPNDILVDDRKSTIDNWNAAGGTGIYYTSADQAIGELQNIGL